MSGLGFVVPGPPKPWQRAIATGRGKRVTPRGTRDYERAIADAAFAAARLAQWNPDKGARFAVRILVTPRTRHRADVDNVAKAVLDGITKAGTVWPDDSHVDELRIFRLPPDREHPETQVTIEKLRSSRHTSILKRSREALAECLKEVVRNHGEPGKDADFYWVGYGPVSKVVRTVGYALRDAEMAELVHRSCSIMGIQLLGEEGVE